jgi:ABC-2 type transport system permease protein
MLSGFVIPIENMPDWVQVITYINPTRYFIEVIRGIFLKSSGFLALWHEVVAMTVFGLVIITLSSIRFHQREK